MTRSVKPSTLAFWFLVLLGLVVIIARAATVNATAPWFSAQLSMSVYTVTLVGASVVAILGAAIASSRASRFEEIHRAVRLRIEAVRDAHRPDLVRSVAVVPTGPTGVGTPDETDALASANLDPELLGREFARQAHALRRARVRLWRSVAGPIAVALGFASAAAMMLPGSGGFAAAHHQLNSTLILTLALGWALVLVWLLLGIATMPGLTGLLREAREEALLD